LSDQSKALVRSAPIELANTLSVHVAIREDLSSKARDGQDENGGDYDEANDDGTDYYTNELKLCESYAKIRPWEAGKEQGRRAFRVLANV